MGLNDHCPYDVGKRFKKCCLRMSRRLMIYSDERANGKSRSNERVKQ